MYYLKVSKINVIDYVEIGYMQLDSLDVDYVRSKLENERNPPVTPRTIDLVCQVCAKYIELDITKTFDYYNNGYKFELGHLKDE